MAARHRKEPQSTKDWKKHSERQPVGRFWEEVRAAGDDKVEPPQDWDAAMCACFRGLLPTLKPRYAEVIRRIDLRGEARRQSLLN